MPPHQVGFLRRLGLKTGKHSGLKLGMLFEGTTGVYECIRCFNSKWVRKKRSMQIQNGFEEFFCLRSNLSNDNIISARSEDQVWKLMWEVTFFGLKIGSAHPHQEFPGVHTPPPPAPPWNCVEPLFELPVENNKNPNFEWRGAGTDRYILFCSPKLPCLNNCIPDCKPSFGLPLRMNGMNRTQFFF